MAGLPGGAVAQGSLGALPELANVRWRRRMDERSVCRRGRLWTLSTVAHTLPFIGGAVVLGLASPIMVPFALLCLVHAWAIPELYAARGARVARRVGGERNGSERVALGLLGDLVDHPARELHGRSGLMLEPGRLGVWLVGEAGALLVRPGGRRVHCYCVRVPGSGLPPSDRVAHLLLALRADELGFVTVANLAFAGAAWRVRRRLPAPARLAVDAARRRVRAG